MSKDAGTAETLVRRHLDLPIAVDRRLREVSFTRAMTRAQLMHALIEQGLDQWQAQGNRTLAERVSEHAQAVPQAPAPSNDVDDT